jgi:hypothetical protein
MGTGEISPIKPEGDNLFDRVVFITFHTGYSDRIPEIRHIQSGVLDAMAMAVEHSGKTPISSIFSAYRILESIMSTKVIKLVNHG